MISTERPESGILLDMLEQLKDLSTSINNSDQARLMILQKLDRVGEDTAQIPNLLYRIEQIEKWRSEVQLIVQSNNDFRIRYETGASQRRTFFGAIAGLFGGAGGAFITWLLTKGGH